MIKTSKDITNKEITAKLKELVKTPDNQLRALVLGLMGLLLQKKLITKKEVEMAKTAGEGLIIEKWKENPEEVESLKAMMSLESIFKR